MANTKQKPQELTFADIFKDKSTLSIVIATVVLLLFSFLAFRYFGGKSMDEGSLNGSGVSDINLEQQNKDEEVDDEASMQEDKNNTNTRDKSKVTQTGQKSGSTSVWVANNYEKNQFAGKDKKYTVTKGDTLWELAEAYYGNGADWHKIADANNVSYLANGNPLITVGQVLTIP